MGLTSEKSLIEVNKLYNLCFEANALCDRISYILSVKFNAIKFGDWFHKNIAHLLVSDKFADGIEAYGELRGDLFYRGMIPEQNQDFINISLAMEAFTLKVSEIEKQCVKSIHICADNNDEGFEDFLRTMNVESISPLLKQATVFYNMAKDYEFGNNAYKINKDFKAFVIPQFRDGE